MLANLRASLRFAERRHDVIAAPQVDVLGPLLGPSWRPGGTAEFCGPVAATLTLAAWLMGRTVGRLVLIDAIGEAHPPALQTLGVEPSRLVLIRPRDRRLALWASEQSLRCPGVGVTASRLGPRVGTTIPRRLKLAAEAGGGMGFFLRPAAREPPFSDARLVVRPLTSEGTDTLRPRLEVESVYLRGGSEGVRCVVELSADARLMSLPATVAGPAGPRLRLG